MKKSIFLSLILLTGIITAMGQNNYENEWKEVESLVNKGLPQSALQTVEKIYSAAKDENNAPQFLKASIYRIKLQADYQEDFMEKAIEKITEELKTSGAPVTQILHSILAELYWRYYQDNRYLLMERTRLANPDPSDINT